MDDYIVRKMISFGGMYRIVRRGIPSDGFLVNERISFVGVCCKDRDTYEWVYCKGRDIFRLSVLRGISVGGIYSFVRRGILYG